MINPPYYRSFVSFFTSHPTSLCCPGRAIHDLKNQGLFPAYLKLENRWRTLFGVSFLLKTEYISIKLSTNTCDDHHRGGNSMFHDREPFPWEEPLPFPPPINPWKGVLRTNSNIIFGALLLLLALMAGAPFFYPSAGAVVPGSGGNALCSSQLCSGDGRDDSFHFYVAGSLPFDGIFF
jgi:hypothetical protein